MRTAALIAAILLQLTLPVLGADFHVDPSAATTDGDGSADRPWKNLQAVIDRGMVSTQNWPSLPYKDDMQLVPRNADGPIKPGDTIWLRSGDYGDLNISGHYNAGPITINAAEGHEPRFRSIMIRAGANWVLRGLHVSPGLAADGKSGTMIDLSSHNWHGPIRDITVENCTAMTARDAADWSAQQWSRQTWNGIAASGTRITIRNCYLKNVRMGITVGASRSLVEGNTIENFSADGMRGLGDHTTFQYNTVRNCYDVDDNHDDGFQSWSRTADGVGRGSVVGIVLRGNTIINYTDPNQPFRGTLQGIGCFDGMFDDWIVENNVVVVDHWHGITLLGARNCRVVNNTVVDVNDQRPGPAWLAVQAHKNKTPSTGNVIRNNLVTALRVDQESNTVDHNLIIDDREKHFVDFANYDLRLKPGSDAVNAGSAELAPNTDASRAVRPQGSAPDIGAFEYKPVTDSPGR